MNGRTFATAPDIVVSEISESLATDARTVIAYLRAFRLLFLGAGGRRGISPTGLVRIPAMGTFS